jgi:hypothetical protein
MATRVITRVIFGYELKNVNLPYLQKDGTTIEINAEDFLCKSFRDSIDEFFSNPIHLMSRFKTLEFNIDKESKRLRINFTT